jgi:hypothetical protein
MICCYRDARECPAVKMDDGTAGPNCARICLYFPVLLIGILILWSMSANPTAFAQTVTSGSEKQEFVGNSKELAIERAREHIRNGLDLGTRHAIYSAQAEFIQALRLIARELDKGTGSHEREEGLDAGWRILENLNQTKPVLEMQQRLFNVQEKLAYCGGHEPMASMALYALARSHIAVAEEVKEESALSGPKAMTLYQAALAVDPANYMAVNELSVLLVRCGQLEEAERVLKHGISVVPQPQMWHNLAVIHEKMGNAALAKQDRIQYDALVAARRARGEDPLTGGLAASVRWTDPAEFVRASGSDEFDQAPTQSVTQSTESKAAQAKTAKTASEPTKNKGLPIPDWFTAAFKGLDGKTSTSINR